MEIQGFVKHFLVLVAVVNGTAQYCAALRPNCDISIIPREVRDTSTIATPNCQCDRPIVCSCTNQYSWIFLKNLSSTVEQLTIHGWLHEIPDRVFQHLPKLHTLHIEAAILCVGDCSFCGLPNLKRLSLTRNVLQPSSYPAIMRTLVGKKLDYLYLDNQYRTMRSRGPILTSSSLKAFRNTSIEFLTLSQNKFVDIQYDGFQFLKKVQCFVISRNSINLHLKQFKLYELYLGLSEMKNLKMFEMSDQMSVIYDPHGNKNRFSRDISQQNCKQAIADFHTNTCNPPSDITDILKSRILSKTNQDVVRFAPPTLMRMYIKQLNVHNVGSDESIPTVPPIRKGMLLGESNISVWEVANFVDSSFCLLPKIIRGFYCTREIYNTNCKIIDVHEESFRYFHRLELLDWSYGQFSPSMLSRNIFNWTKVMHTLKLRRTGLTCEMINRNNSFIATDSLTSLDLANNHLDCFPLALMKQLPNIQRLNLSGHGIRWFDKRTLVYFNDIFAKTKGNVSFDITGRFQCTCDSESIEFLDWFQKNDNNFVNGPQAVCTTVNASNVLINGLDLQGFASSCTDVFETYTQEFLVIYLTLGVTGFVLLAGGILFAVKKDYFCYKCLMFYIRRRKHSSVNRTDTEVELLPDEDAGRGHTMLVYNSHDGFSVADVRKALLRKNCPVFDMDTGLNSSLDTNGYPVPSPSDWHKPGGYVSETFCKGMDGASVIIIFSSPNAIQDGGFCRQVRMVLEHKSQKHNLPIVLVRQAENTELEAFGTRALGKLALGKKKVTMCVLNDEDSHKRQKKLGCMIRLIRNLRDNYDAFDD